MMPGMDKGQSQPSFNALPEDEAHGASDPLDGVDIALGIIGLPVLGAALMFATSGMTIALARREKRRRMLATFVAIEVVLVAVVLFAIFH